MTSSRKTSCAKMRGRHAGRQWVAIAITFVLAFSLLGTPGAAALATLGDGTFAEPVNDVLVEGPGENEGNESETPPPPG